MLSLWDEIYSPLKLKGQKTDLTELALIAAQKLQYAIETGQQRATSLKVRTKHRLEAYAPAAFRTVERSPRAIPGAMAVHLE
jgi:hypothetical protein